MQRRPLDRITVLLLAAGLLAGLMAIPPALDARAATYTEGIDVSHWQGTISWSRVKGSGRTFAFLKATQGLTYNDPTYATNRANANANGIAVGAYHFADVTGNGAREEADHFIATAGIRAGDLPPVLDIETTGGLGPDALTTWILNWLNRVKNQTGVRPIVYTSPGQWSIRTNNTTAIADAGYDLLWVAHWTTNISPTMPANNWGGRGWTFWQYDNCGSVPGISGCVDVDRYKSTDVTPVKIRSLSLTKTSTGGATARFYVNGTLQCGFDCTSYQQLANGGDSITLTAVGADAGTSWTWGGACAGAVQGGPCTVSMTADRAVTMNVFSTTSPLDVTVAGTGSGSVASTPAGITCATGQVGTCAGPFTFGSTVTLTPTASAGSAFAGWSGACTGAAACSVTMDVARSVTATFSPTTTLTVTRSGTGTGTVNTSPGGACTPTCSLTYPVGQALSLSGVAAGDSRFVGWSGACSGSTACSMTISGPSSANAIFAIVYTRTITFDTATPSVRKGTIVNFAGVLSSSNAACLLSGQTVGLYSGSTLLATTTTGSGGSYTFSRKVSATTTFTAKALEILPATLGNAICGQATSTSRTVSIIR